MHKTNELDVLWVQLLVHATQGHNPEGRAKLLHRAVNALANSFCLDVLLMAPHGREMANKA